MIFEVLMLVLSLALAANASDANNPDHDEDGTIHTPSHLVRPPDGNDNSCAASFVLEGDIVTWQPYRGEYHRTATLRVTNAIKGTAPREVSVVTMLRRENLYPGDHVVVIGDVEMTREGTPKLVMNTRPVVRDQANVARFPIALWNVTPSKDRDTGPWTFRPRTGPAAPTAVVYAQWSPLIIVFEAAPGPERPELPYMLYDPDPRAFGASWEEIIRQMTAAPHSAPGCALPGRFPEAP